MLIFFHTSHTFVLCATICTFEGGYGLSKEQILATTTIASVHTQALHKKLNEAVRLLEDHVIEEKAVRLELMRGTKQASGGSKASGPSAVPMVVDEDNTIIGKDDPLLQWDSLHEARGASEEQS